MTIQLKRIFWTLSVILYFASTSIAQIKYTNWNFNDLTSVGGVDVVPEGNPEIIRINKDSAYLFDGDEDRVVLDQNPLIGLNEFTLEVVFRVDEGGVSEQKMFHMQANPDIRLLFEVEFVNDSMWYMENFIQTGSGAGENIHLMDSTKLHPVNRWVHIAVVYKNNTFKQYINYKLENTGDLTWVAPDAGSISVGARINKRNYLTGAVREIRFADTALDSTQFLFYEQLLEQHETYVLDNLEEINGYSVQRFGDPQVVETEIGQGIEFDGTEDGIYILSNPIGAASHFTIETIILPRDVAPANADPRYLHIEDGDNSNRRITMELRLNDMHEWYFDGFLKASSSSSVGLMDETLTHPIDSWEHMAISYDNGHFKTYVNYKSELESNWGPKFLPMGDNTKMSVGMRMNKVNYFQGIIQRIRVTQAVLDSSEFMTIHQGLHLGVHPLINEDEGDHSELNVHVFPNPARGIVKIQLKSARAGFASIELSNVMGLNMAELFNAKIAEGLTEVSFDTSNFPRGLYVLIIRNNRSVTKKKLLIN